MDRDEMPYESAEDGFQERQRLMKQEPVPRGTGIPGRQAGEDVNVDAAGPLPGTYDRIVSILGTQHSVDGSP
jgi:hypothetical protein